MINALHTIAGPAAVDVELDGDDYRLSDLRLCDWASIERRLIVRSLGQSNEQPPTGAMRDVWAGDIWAFIQSVEGQALVWRLMLRRHHSEISDRRAKELFEHIEPHKLHAAAIALAGIIRAGISTHARDPHVHHEQCHGDAAVFPWQSLFRRASERYGWTPSGVAELTPVQMSAFNGPQRHGPQFEWMSPAEARELKDQLRGTREYCAVDQPPETVSHYDASCGQRPHDESPQVVLDSSSWIDALADAWQSALNDLSGSIRHDIDPRRRSSLVSLPCYETHRAASASPGSDVDDVAADAEPTRPALLGPLGDHSVPHPAAKTHADSPANDVPHHVTDSDDSPIAPDQQRRTDDESDLQVADPVLRPFSDQVSQQPNHRHGRALNEFDGRLNQLDEHLKRLDRIARRLEEPWPRDRFRRRTARFV